MILPASAYNKIILVDDIFSPNLNNVVIKSMVGNTENCNTSVVNIVKSIIITDIVILRANNISNRPLGSGTIIINTIPITPKGIIMSIFLFIENLFPCSIQNTLYIIS